MKHMRHAPIGARAVEIVRADEHDDDARAVLQVHDEIIFEVRDEIAADFAAQIGTVMENVCTLRVPLVVETAIGTRWSEL